MIIKTPRGEAPEHIRQAWVGIVLPCVGKLPSYWSTGVLTGQQVDYGEEDTYCVSQAEACAILAKTQPMAAAWWKAHGYPKPDRAFSFCEDEVMPLQENEDQTAWG